MRTKKPHQRQTLTTHYRSTEDPFTGVNEGGRERKRDIPFTFCKKLFTTEARAKYFPKIQKIYPEFQTLSEEDRLPFLLEERIVCVTLAAEYVATWNSLRDSK